MKIKFIKGEEKIFNVFIPVNGLFMPCLPSKPTH